MRTKLVILFLSVAAIIGNWRGESIAQENDAASNDAPAAEEKESPPSDAADAGRSGRRAREGGGRKTAAQSGSHRRAGEVRREVRRVEEVASVDRRTSYPISSRRRADAREASGPVARAVPGRKRAGARGRRCGDCRVQRCAETRPGRHDVSGVGGGSLHDDRSIRIGARHLRRAFRRRRGGGLAKRLGSAWRRSPWRTTTSVRSISTPRRNRTF